MIRALWWWPFAMAVGAAQGLVLGAFGSPDRYATQCTCGPKLASETCAVHGRKGERG